MATLVPQRQHSFMSPATWQARQGKQNAPQQPGRGRNTAVGEALPTHPAPPALGEELGGQGYMAVAIAPPTRAAGARKVSQRGHGIDRSMSLLTAETRDHPRHSQTLQSLQQSISPVCHMLLETTGTAMPNCGWTVTTDGVAIPSCSSERDGRGTGQLVTEMWLV